MRKVLITTVIIALSVSFIWSQPKVQLNNKPGEKKVEILVSGELFTSYIYPDDIKKPVLWPVITSEGNEVTRQFPLKSKAGERVDHPHHVGIWLNYGDVNGLDFWNNSEARPKEKADEYGTIYHEDIKEIESGRGEGNLTTTASWKDNQGNKLLHEVTEYTFSVDNSTRIIDRVTKLKAVNGKVKITDNKEGMFAIRVTRELELPASGNVKVVDSHGNVTTIKASEEQVATGDYLSSEGITGGEVWGTRARWMKLSGVINNEKVAIVIFDHPANAGYPTYWHARGYGLFSANPLGQKIFSEGKEEMNFVIKDGESATFRFRLAVFSGDPSVEEIEKIAGEFESKI